MVQVVDRSELEKFIGYEAEPTAWHTITQEQINQFADCTLDHQFIHVDPEKAKQTVFGTTIAHGFLSLSMLSHFAESYSIVVDGLTMGINSGFDKVRFLSPVKVGSRIRAVAVIADIKETWADIDKAFKLFDWKPQVSLDEGLKETVDWHVANERDLPDHMRKALVDMESELKKKIFREELGIQS